MQKFLLLQLQIASTRAEELGVKGFIADLTKESDVQALESKISNLDILVNNTGMISVTSPAPSGMPKKHLKIQ